MKVAGARPAFLLGGDVDTPSVMAWLRRSFAAGFAALGAKLAFAER